MVRGRIAVVAAIAVVMVATLLGSPAQADPDPGPVSLSLSYAQRCDDVGAAMKPPAAQLFDADRNPLVGEELTWTWREILSSSTYGEPHVYGTATTDATGAAAVSVEPAVLDRPVLWNVKSAATDAHMAGSAVAKQRLLTGGALQPRASIYYDPLSPKFYGLWKVKGSGVT